MATPFDKLNFNLFDSMQGGETDASGQFTEAGKKDFFAPLWSDSSTDEWKRFLSGKYDWKDYLLNPGSVIANPAQQLADPGRFFSGDWFRNNVMEGKVGDRTAMSALIAALAYGGGSALSGMGGEGAGGSSLSSTGADPSGMGAVGQEIAGGGGETSGFGNFLSNLKNFFGDQGASSNFYGQMGQSFSASEPESWQYQVSQTGARSGASQQTGDIYRKMTTPTARVEATKAKQPSALGGLDMPTLISLLLRANPTQGQGFNR